MGKIRRKKLRVLMKLHSIRKQTFCKHDWYLFERFSGDIRNIFYGNKRCNKCGKIKLIRVDDKKDWR